MSTLYRKYRPQVFGDVIGQDHLKTALSGALKKGLVGHAYLFYGPRGTGKTSVARLFARAVNCQTPKDGIEPCNKCEICLQLTGGTSVDVIEIDAASNRGIDEIRELRDRVAFAPSGSKYKVYIIDEVHMLTKEAFNALLKTLEEPPSHVIFILATTELHKVPETIISRCQRYQFHRASQEALTSVLQSIAKKEKIGLDTAAAELIARRAEGSFRDALTLLGNASAEEQLSVENLRQLLGLPPTEVVAQLKQALLGNQSAIVQKVLSEALAQGSDVTVLVKTVADEFKEELLTAADPSALGPVAHLLEALLVVLARARVSSDPTALVVARLVQLVSDNQKMMPNRESVSVASEPVKAETVAVDAVKEPAGPPVAVDAVSEAPKSEPIVTAAPSGEFWPSFLSEVKNHNHALYAVVRAAELAELTGEKVVIAVKFKFYADRLAEIKNRKLLEKIAETVVGAPRIVEAVVKTDLAVPIKNTDDLMEAVVDVFELEEAK